MQGSITDALAHQWLEQIANSAFVSLHYDTPALGGIGACEISGGGYARAKTAFSQPSNRSIWSLTDATYTGLVQNQLTYFGIWDAPTKGLLMAYAPLPNKVMVLNGWGYSFREGDLAISIG